MKLRLGALLLVYFSSISHAGLRAQGQEPQSYAMVVGVNTYPHLPDSVQLRFAESDATQFEAFLRSPRGGGVRAFAIKRLMSSQATREAIQSTLAGLRQKADSGLISQLTIYFAGHGALASTGNAYLLPYDGDDDAPSLRGILVDELIANLADFPVSHIRVFIDACRAGAGTARVGARMSETWHNKFMNVPSTAVALFGSNGETDSYEDDTLGHGVFTYYLLQALKGDADKDKNRLVSAGEAFLYTLSHVQEHVAQRFKTSQWIEQGRPFMDAVPLTSGGPAVDSLESLATWAREQYFHAQDLVERDGAENRREAQSVLYLITTRVPEYADAHFLLGTLALERHQYIVAKREFSTVLLLDPNYIEAYIRLSRALRGANRLAEASQYLYEAVQRKPADNRVRNQLVQLLLDQREYLAAVEQARLSVRSHPEDSQAVRLLSEGLHEGLNLFEDAYAVNQKRVSRHPRDSLAKLDYMENLFTTGRFQECANDAVRLRKEYAFDADYRLVTQLFEAACLVAQNRLVDARAGLAGIVALLQAEQVVTLRWNFGGAKAFLAQDRPELAMARAWLSDFITALASEPLKEAMPRLLELDKQLAAQLSP